MKKTKLNLTCFRAFTTTAELHVTAETKEAASAIAKPFLGKEMWIMSQMDTEFTRMLLSKRKVGYMDTTSISDKNLHHDTHVTEGRKLPFVEVK